MNPLPATTHEAAKAGNGLRLWCHRDHAVDIPPDRLLSRRDMPLENVRAQCPCGSIARDNRALLPPGWKDPEPPTRAPEPFLHRRPKPVRHAKMWAVAAVFDAALTKAGAPPLNETDEKAPPQP